MTNNKITNTSIFHTITNEEDWGLVNCYGKKYNMAVHATVDNHSIMLHTQRQTSQVSESNQIPFISLIQSLK